jgi:hypothetical protein
VRLRPLIGTVLALLWTLAVAQTSPLSLPFDEGLDGDLLLDRTALPTFDSGGDPSPNGLRTLWRVVEGADSTTLYIAERGDDAALRLTIGRHADTAPVVRWVNDEVLFLRVRWGRVASSELLLDTAAGSFLYRRTIAHLPESPAGGAIPHFRLRIEHLQGAPPPTWRAFGVLSGPEVRQVEATTLPPMVTECFLEPTDAELIDTFRWLSGFVQERLDDAPPRPVGTVCRNCTLYRLSWELPDGASGSFDYSEARPFRYQMLDVLFPLLDALHRRMTEEGECSA